jgi:N-acetyl-anhydromuramyl-L-alanine amidase AmpD
MDFINLDYSKSLYSQKKSKKWKIILGDTGRANSNHLNMIETLNIIEDTSYISLSTFTISRNGTIYKHFNPEYTSNFLGNEIDKNSISIFLENMGALYYKTTKNEYINIYNEPLEHEDMLFDQKWNNYRYWERYTEEQITACIKLCKNLIKEYGISNNCLGYNVTDMENAVKFYGITCRSNYSSDFKDVNPSFDFKRLIKEIS